MAGDAQDLKMYEWFAWVVEQALKI